LNDLKHFLTCHLLR